MRNSIVFSIILGFMFLITGCNYPTLQEAINNDIPYKVSEVIHTKKIDDITVVLYTTEAKGEEFSYIKEPVLGVAFIKGNNKEGWKNDGPNGWEHYQNENYTIYYQPYTKYNEQGELLKDFDVVYGEINNKDIQKIEIAKQGMKDFTETKMIKQGNKRYYLGIGYHPEVRAVSSNGEVINQ
ncbi:hypothetical protein [Metabacillus sediminilitoris]|uniref:Lipoprotein n=1 Tax=Metabacillus sediminilitoris TaxID=2567941 RepID=A0A4S4BJL6_9BACI|nr:hypothetical protein [Metabacillus sediminilitoris]QGQ45756.1 hypothetical protein GMB29_11235 [Metabacillus sediminilitoris]THF74862.1 hypothetical protein E6W99_24630 [Metabacillus sediminilitoris]